VRNKKAILLIINYLVVAWLIWLGAYYAWAITAGGDTLGRRIGYYSCITLAVTLAVWPLGYFLRRR